VTTGIPVRSLPPTLRKVAAAIERAVRDDPKLRATLEKELAGTLVDDGRVDGGVAVKRGSEVERDSVLTPKLLAQMQKRLVAHPDSLPFSAGDLERIAKHLPKPETATTPRKRKDGTTSPVGTRLPGTTTTGAAGTTHATAACDHSGDLSRLNATQRRVVADVFKKASERSDKALAELTKKAERLGISKADLKLTLDYIKNDAPLTIAFHPDKQLQKMTSAYGTTPAHMPKYEISVDRDKNKLIDAFLKDGVYRNQFETGITCGSSTAYPGGSRDGWEKTIFESGYHGHDLIPDERPKYGSLNAVQKAAGTATSYGSCYFVLKPGARDRTSFTPSNSSSCRAEQVGTVDGFAHVLNGIYDDYFKAIVQVAKEKKPADTGWWSYIEAQVHGPVDFNTDVESVVVDVKFKGTEYEKKLRTFAEKYAVKLQWHDEKKVWNDGDA